MSDRTIIEFDPEEIAAAIAWHGGQSSMLYAIASTGALSLGTVRPRERTEDGPWTPLTDLEWKRSLVDQLYSEADSNANDACEGAAVDESDEMLEHVEALRSIAAKCATWLAANPEVAS